jgi:hypothetical protein
MSRPHHSRCSLWADGNDQLAVGANLASFAVLAGVGLAAALAANEAFRRFDVR